LGIEKFSINKAMNDTACKIGERDIQKRAFSFACRIISFYRFLAQQVSVGEILGRQIPRSGTSIGANLEEATAAQSKADFVSKCNIALKETRETHYWLRLFTETHVVATDRLSGLLKESDELIAILTTIVKKTKSSD
jgi:four helix bundle protein